MIKLLIFAEILFNDVYIFSLLIPLIIITLIILFIPLSLLAQSAFLSDMELASFFDFKLMLKLLKNNSQQFISLLFILIALTTLFMFTAIILTIPIAGIIVLLFLMLYFKITALAFIAQFIKSGLKNTEFTDNTKSRKIYVLSAVLIFIISSCVLFPDMIPVRENIKLSDKLVKKGIEKHMKREYVTANLYYDLAIKVYPNSSWAYNGKGYNYIVRGNYKKAKPNIDKAIEISALQGGCYYDAFYNMGLVYQKEKKFKLAKDYYLKSLKCKPNYAKPYLQLGIIERNNNKNYQKSLEYLKEYIKYQPKDAEGYYGAGITYDKLGRYKESIDSYLKAYKLAPERNDVNINLSYEYLQVEDYKNAVKYATNVLKRRPYNTYALTNRSTAYVKLKMYDKALIDADKAVAKKLEYYNKKDYLSGSLFQRAEAKKGLKDFEGAKRDYEKALKYAQKEKDFELIKKLEKELK